MQEWSVSALCQGSTPSRSNASLSLHGSSLLMFGGSDEAGSPTDSLCVLDLTGLAKGRGWRSLDCSGQPPTPRWGHNAFVYGQQLWVYGGFDGQEQLDDMYKLDLDSLCWQRVEQAGARPDRQLGKNRSFQSVAVSAAGHMMLAFGAAPKDAENTDPDAAGSGLRLHAFDLDACSWSTVHSAGSVTFQKLEGLQCHRDTLVALGWSAASGKANSGMQVCCLDLSSMTSCRTPTFGSARPRPTPTWQLMKAHGMLPTSRTAAASCVLHNQMLLHGGMLCSKGVEGRLTADAFCLNLSTMGWTKLAPAQERAVGSSSINVPRASHRAVAVPGAAAVMLIGGTSSRQAFASCDSIECLRQIAGGAAVGAASSDYAATSAGQPLGIEEVLSATPTLLGIQPFGHVTSTPKVIQAAGAGTFTTTPKSAATSNLPVATPMVLCSTPGAAADAAALAAAPSSSLLPAFDFSSFCFSDTLSDIELVSGETFPAHRLLLCAQSPRFAQLIQAQAAAGSGQVPGAECRWTLHLPDLYPDVLRLMLQYMYCNLPSIPVEAAPLLFKAADRYGLDGLRAACLRVVIATIDLDNVCQNVLLAHDHKCSELSQSCILFVAASPERFQEVLATPGYLHLNQSHPRVGTAFVQSVTQLLMAPGR